MNLRELHIFEFQSHTMHDQSDILNHLGEDREEYMNAVAPPIFQSSNFSFTDVAAMRKGLEDECKTPFYTRGCNPTVVTLRKKLAALEKAENSLVFASGSAAIAAAVFSIVKAGDHIVCVEKPYSWANKLLNNTLVKYGVETTMVDGTDPENFRKAIKPNTTLIYLESPNSMTFELQDIPAVTAIAKEHGIATVLDNSYSTPLFQNPLEMGVDLVMHSASKYLNGHSDIVAGVVCGSNARIEKLMAEEFMTFGGIISPNDAWLMIRGLRTLHIRTERSAANGKMMVDFLENHPKVEKVLYPFSKNNPQYDLAKRQMKDCSGLFTILLKTEDMGAVERFVNSLERFLIACSWGGHEALVFPVCALIGSENYSKPNIPVNMVRMYTGLEDGQTLIDDVSQALDKM